MPNWCAPQVPMCWSWSYNAVNPPLRKADHLCLATGDMVCGQLLNITISWAKNINSNFCTNPAVFAKTVTIHGVLSIINLTVSAYVHSKV